MNEELKMKNEETRPARRALLISFLHSSFFILHSTFPA